MQNMPKNMTEAEFVSAIERVVNVLAGKFRFGYHGVEDMKQQGILFALRAIASGKYDESRPLENFIYTHVRNRLINYKRDKYKRSESPCRACIFFDPQCKKSVNQCAAFENKDDCKKLEQWKRRNSVKQGLMQAVDVDSLPESSIEQHDPTFDNSSFRELELLLDAHIPIYLRSDYLRLRAGQTIPKIRRDQLRAVVYKILVDHDRLPEGWDNDEYETKP